MKRILIGLLASAIYMIPAWAVEDNNPCTHDWGDKQYECDTGISEKKDANKTLPCSSATVSAVKSAAKNAVETGGKCQPYKICKKCGERKDEDSSRLTSLSASYESPNYDTEADQADVLRTTGHTVRISAKCHDDVVRECSVTIYVESHNHKLETAKEDRDIKECYMNGRVPHNSPNQDEVALQSLSIPLGSRQIFSVDWSNPQAGGITDGIEYFLKKGCKKCSVTWSYDENSRPYINHSVEHPTPTGGGVYDPNGWKNYTFSFPDVGENLKIAFCKKCKEYTGAVHRYESEETSVFTCEEGKFDYTVNSVGVASLDYEPKLPKVYFKAIQEGERTKKTLYVLSEIKEEDVKEDGNKARGATAITFTTAATGSKGFPSVHPILGGFSDDELSDSQKETRDNYKYPTWSAGHDSCQYKECKPEHYTFTGEAGATTAVFTGKSMGTYTVSVTCGTEQNPADPYDNFGTRTRFVRVCDPVAIADFDVRANDKGQKVIDDLSPCDAMPIKITFGGNINYAPEGGKAYLTIEADPKTYELYKDPAGIIEAGAADLEVEITNSQSRKEVYLLPIQKDSKTLTNTYKATTKYGIAGTLIKADDREDLLTVNWKESGCSGTSCSAPWLTAQNSSVLVQGSFGRGAWGKSGGTFQIYSEKLNYRLLDINSFNSGNDENGAAIMLDPMLRFAYGNSSTVKIATEADETAGSGNIAGYPIRVCTGQYCSEFTYRKATVGEFTFVDKMTMTQYLSNSMDASVAMTGTPVSVATIEMVYNTTIPATAAEPEVTALTITNTQYSGGTQTTQTWGFTVPETTCPDLTGEYTISQLSENGVNNILVKQDYTENGVRYRREIRYIGSMTNPASKEDRTYRMFDWGEEIVSETVGGGTTTYEYYTDGNGRSKQKKITYPQGNSITFLYNADNDVASQTEVRGNLTYVTTYEYGYDEANKKRTVTTVQKVGDVTVARNQSVTYETRPNSNPDESISYDEDNTAFVTKTWYVQGPNGAYDIRPSRQENPDGTVTVYSYNRSGDSETTTTESGVFSGNTLTLGTRQVSVSNGNGVNVSNESWFIDTANNVNVKTASTVNSNFDEFGRALTTTYLDGSTVTRTYGCCGVESETDQNGTLTTYAYDEFKRISHTIRDGITTLYSYDDLGNQTAVTTKGRDDGEITTSSTYSNGELASTSDALGNVTTYTRNYATAGNNTTYTETVTNPDGSTQITTYLNGQQTGISGTAVHPQTFEYGPNWQKTLPQNQTVYTDLLGRQYKTVYADGTEALQYYNNKNQVIKSVSPAGRVTLYEYDGLGRQTKQAIDMNANGEIDSADLVTSTAYSYGTESGKTVSITTVTQSQGENSKVTAIEKQSLDGLEQWSTDAAGLTTHIKQERLGNGITRQTQTNPDGTGVVTNMQNGTVTSVQQMNSDGTAGNVTTYTYDEYNRNTGTVGKAGETVVNTFSMTYDAAGQILSQTVNGQTTTYAYDIVNRLKTTTLPGNRVIVEESWPTGELKRLSGADTYTQEWTWDPVWGTQATLTTWKEDAIPQVTTWVYNNRGFNTAKQYADNNGPTYTYDADGNMLTRTWARGVVTTYTYDAAGRMTGQSYSDDTPAITMVYNFLNQPLTITDAAGVRTLTYNSQSLLENETIPGIMNNMGNSYSYDAYGRRILRRLNTNGAAQAVSGIAYDVKGRVASIGNGADTLHYAYRPGLSQLDTATWRNSQDAVLNSRSYAYDAYHRLTGINLNNASEVAYTLNDKDQRTAASYAVGGAWSYSYDDKSQVTGAIGNNTTFSYAYDGIGNRLTAAEGSDTWSYTSNLLNQYTAINSNQPTYDADGNMLTTGDGWLYTWNGENRLIRAENSDTLVEMAYDYMGRRVEKKVSSKGLFTFYNWNVDKHYKFAYDDYKLIAVYDAANNNALLMTFTWQPESVGLDVPVSMSYDGNTYYYVTDGNKNVTGLLDQAGNRVAGYIYGPFGQLLGAEGELAEVNPFRFSSEYADDETGLVYYNYRYYSPSLGRWIKRDPIEEKGGINLYHLVENRTILSWDILGLEWEILRDKQQEWATAQRTSVKNDTIDELASKVSLSKDEVLEWLRNSDLSSVTQKDLGRKRCFKVPNSFVVVTGDGGIAGPILDRWAMQITNALDKKNIYVKHFHSSIPVKAKDISAAVKSDNNLGYALLGHGNRVIRAWYDFRTDPSFKSINGAFVFTDNIDYYFIPSDFKRGFKYALGINYHCYADMQDWRSLSIKYFGSTGMLSALSGTRGIGYWGTWAGLINQTFGE